MSWWSKHVSGKVKWSSVRQHVLAGATALAAPGPIGLAAAGAIETAYYNREQQKAADAQAKAAEEAAKSGALVDTGTATPTADTQGDEAYKRKQKQLASGSGRSGTSGISSNLGGGGSVG